MTVKDKRRTASVITEHGFIHIDYYVTNFVRKTSTFCAYNMHVLFRTWQRFNYMTSSGAVVVIFIIIIKNKIPLNVKENKYPNVKKYTKKYCKYSSFMILTRPKKSKKFNLAMSIFDGSTILIVNLCIKSLSNKFIKFLKICFLVITKMVISVCMLLFQTVFKRVFRVGNSTSWPSSFPSNRSQIELGYKP